MLLFASLFFSPDEYFHIFYPPMILFVFRYVCTYEWWKRYSHEKLKYKLIPGIHFIYAHLYLWIYIKYNGKIYSVDNASDFSFVLFFFCFRIICWIYFFSFFISNVGYIRIWLQIISETLECYTHNVYKFLDSFNRISYKKIFSMPTYIQWNLLEMRRMHKGYLRYMTFILRLKFVYVNVWKDYVLWNAILPWYILLQANRFK